MPGAVFCGLHEGGIRREVGRVLETLDTTGAALTESLAREREAASEALDFERAAAIHKRLEKAVAALRGMPELARRIESLDAVILQRAAEEKTIIVFPLHAGILAEPIFLRFAELSSQPRSIETILRTNWKRKRPSSADAKSSQPEANGQTVQVNDLRSRRPMICAPVRIACGAAGIARASFAGRALVLLKSARGRDFLSRRRMALPPNPASVRPACSRRPQRLNPC